MNVFNNKHIWHIIIIEKQKRERERENKICAN